MAELSPVARALLETIAGPESKGDYNVIYGGGKFTDYADHPRQFVEITSGPNKGQYSSAAGKYQFLGSTWDDQAAKLGLTDFSPASQDAAAWNLAQETYKAKTGRSLLADLDAGDTSRIPAALKGQWTSLPGGIEQGITGSAFANAYAANLGGKLPGIGPTGGPALNAINAATAPKPPGMLSAALGSLTGMVGQGTAPIMRAAGDAVGQYGPAIMRAANPFGTVAGRTAIIDPFIKNVFNGAPKANVGSGGYDPTKGVFKTTLNQGPVWQSSGPAHTSVNRNEKQLAKTT